ncbi:MAG: hypothetical protein A2W35_06665 [Chloroflexi bacterium RBG_16_57_11]|nr:MAG: hypothetical protein A2W35_06665 [Chloroflexi bacterium RBG_16_57_11]
MAAPLLASAMQRKFSFRRTRKIPGKLLSIARSGYARANQEAAAIILADRGKYAGLPVEWAELVLGGAPPAQTQTEGARADIGGVQEGVRGDLAGM